MLIQNIKNIYAYVYIKYTMTGYEQKEKNDRT